MASFVRDKLGQRGSEYIGIAEFRSGGRWLPAAEFAYTYWLSWRSTDATGSTGQFAGQAYRHLKILVPLPPKKERAYDDDELSAARDAILADPPCGVPPDYDQLVALIMQRLPGAKSAHVRTVVTGHTGRRAGRPKGT
ncbi:MAG TPA: hypothetical protein VME45_06010 [Stellaceae bacterium]|nr:hypothetical protein [Stellaceae bacterium]